MKVTSLPAEKLSAFNYYI